MLNRKALSWKKWRISTHIQDKLAYKEYSIKCKNALTLYLHNKELDVISCGNIGKFCRYVNNKQGSRRTVQPINACTNINELTHNPLEQANLFNKYFSRVFTVDNASKPVIPLRTVDNIRCDSVIFNADNVRKDLRSLKPSTSSSSSSGPDGVPNVLLKKPAYSVCNPLCYIFDSSVKSHCLPSQWLQAYAMPVFEKGATSDPSNYRPISLTCTYNYRINDYKLQWSSCTRDLGIYVNNDLKFAQHISKITHIGHSRAAPILKCFFTCGPEGLLYQGLLYLCATNFGVLYPSQNAELTCVSLASLEEFASMEQFTI